MYILSNHFYFIISWCVCWLSMYGIYELGFRPKEIGNSFQLIVICTYFLGASFLAGKLLGVNSIIFNKLGRLEILRKAILICAVYIVLALITSWLIPVSPEKLDWFVSLGLHFPSFSSYALIWKVVNVFSQQFLIWGLVFKLFYSFELKKDKVILLSCIAFCLIHLPMVYRMSYQALLFIIPASFAGGIFSYLILRSSNGAYHAKLFHLSFYLCLGIALRIY